MPNFKSVVRFILVDFNFGGRVTKLTGLSISTDHMTGDDWGRQSRIYNQMRQTVEPGPTLLYVTPEKLSSSTSLLSALTSVYNRQKLSMFVIDEAHCVSQWGHDFRPDYKKLSTLRHNFPQVRIKFSNSFDNKHMILL